MRAESEVAERQQYLSFVLRGGDYAVPILKVKEILQFEGFTPVPGTPASVRGVLNLRGSVVPVVDLGLKFGLGETAPSRFTCVLVVETELERERTLMGVLADSVREVTELGVGDIEEPPPFGTGVTIDWLLGMGKLEKGFMLLLDIDRVLASDEEDLVAAVRAAREAATAPPEGDEPSTVGTDTAPEPPGQPSSADTKPPVA